MSEAGTLAIMDENGALVDDRRGRDAIARVHELLDERSRRAHTEEAGDAPAPLTHRGLLLLLLLLLTALHRCPTTHVSARKVFS